MCLSYGIGVVRIFLAKSHDDANPHLFLGLARPPGLGSFFCGAKTTLGSLLDPFQIHTGLLNSLCRSNKNPRALLF